MEFNEKLQKLRKERGITQEELAAELYVSRTAISKWESGRGYPNIDSLKAISEFFSVSVDDLLSSNKLLVIAENENKESVKRIFDFIAALLDVFSVALVVLPLYPHSVNGFVYGLNLLNYSQISSINLIVHWIIIISLCVIGITRLLLLKTKAEKIKNILSGISVVLNALAVIFLALTRESYAVVVVFLIFAVKIIMMFKSFVRGSKSG
jgi:transcriptional regulator with XRE-family HTH domain